MIEMHYEKQRSTCKTQNSASCVSAGIHNFFCYIYYFGFPVLAPFLRVGIWSIGDGENDRYIYIYVKKSPM